MGRSRRQTFVVALAATCAAGIGGAVLVSAQSPGTIQACVNNFGTIRISSDPSGFHGQACQSFSMEHPVTINGLGPPGPAGPAGPAGPPGPAGPAGRAGSDATTPAGATTTASGAATNFIAGGAFTMGSQFYVRAEIDCPKGDVATGGSAAVVSPLGEFPAFDGPSPGVGVVGTTGRPAVGWLAEARNTTAQAASLRITIVCAGPVADARLIVRHVLLSRRLHATRAGGH